MLDKLSVPGLDVAAGTLTLPLWAAGAAAALLLLLLVLAAFRSGFGVVIAGLARIALVVLAAAVAWTFVNRFAERDRADERRALDQRVYDLTARVLEPNSVLGCLEPGLGEAVDGACEKQLFAGPETVGAATALVAARWSLLVNGLDYARKDPGYEASLDGLRRTLQADRFGFLAQVLSTREGCTISKCDGLEKLSDANRVRANLSERMFEALVTRNAAAWPSRARGAAPMAAAPAPAPTGPVAGSGVAFPSAASIPPVSIMSSEPSAGAAPAPPAKRPPQPRAQPRPGTAQPAPANLAPAAATGTAAPPRP
jgi:hypothetical protein